MMGEWVSVKLGDMAQLQKKIWKVGDKKNNYIGLEHISENSLRLSSIGNSDCVTSNKFMFEAGNTLFGKLRPYFRKVLKPNFNGICSTDIWVIKPKNNVDKDFLFYFFANQELIDIASASSEGTRMPRADWNFLSKTKWDIPPLPEQKAIAEVLSSLDDKIDLLHRQNKTLEALAETLFRQWFVEEASEDWEVCKIEEVAIVQNGFSFSSKQYVPFRREHLEVLKMGHIKREGGLKINPKKNFVPREEKLKKWILNKNDIVIAMTDMKDKVVILGVPAIVDESDKYVLNQRVARIYLKSYEKLLDSYLLYVQMKDPDFIALLQSKANSGVQVNLSTESIKESEIVVPPMDIQKEKGQSIIDLFLKKENNDKQIRSLEVLRNTLLPKLMSGEVRVSHCKGNSTI
jgi:type I restriction enzyme, S subunit